MDVPFKEFDATLKLVELLSTSITYIFGKTESFIPKGAIDWMPNDFVFAWILLGFTPSFNLTIKRFSLLLTFDLANPPFVRIEETVLFVKLVISMLFPVFSIWSFKKFGTDSREVVYKLLIEFWSALVIL